MDETAPIRDFEKLLRETIGLSMETVGASVIRHALKRRMTACAISDLHAYWAFVTSLKPENDTVALPSSSPRPGSSAIARPSARWSGICARTGPAVDR